MSYTSQRKSSGFSLIELLITLGILIITLTIALPGFREFFDRERLINATEEVYGMLQKARMESMARSDEIYVNFDSDTDTGTWSYGLVEGTQAESGVPCDPTQDDPAVASACVITIVSGDGSGTNDKVLMRHTNDQHPEISLDAKTETIFRFDPIRGTVETEKGDRFVTLISGLKKELRVTVSPLGNVGICSPDGQVPSYRDC